MPRPKRPSGSKRDSSNQNHSLPELFCDRSLGRRKVASRLREVHPVVIAHDDVFPQDVDDEVWLEEAGRRRWIVLTRDDRIRYRPAEQLALVRAGTAVFCLNPSKDMIGEDMAQVFVVALPKILQIASANPKGGFVKGVNRRGQIRHLFP